MALSRVRLGVLLAVGMALFSPAVARAESPAPKAARWVKADALIYLEVMQPTDLLDRAGDAPVQALVSRNPDIERYLQSDDYKKARAEADRLLKALDTTGSALLRDLLSGGIVIAAEAERGRAPTLFMIVTPRDSEVLNRANKQLLDRVRGYAAQGDGKNPIQESTHRGITEYVANPRLAYAIAGGCLIAASGKDALEPVLDRVLDPAKVGKPISDDALWKERRAKVEPDALAWGFTHLDVLRQIDPKKFQVPEQVNPAATMLLGHWIECLRKAPWASVSLTWTAGRLGAEITVATPPGGLGDALKKFVPPEGKNAAPLLEPPGTILSLGLWRDLSALWEVRTDLLTLLADLHLIVMQRILIYL
jgi:hypothetical protein